jgi:radical SAM superfamily enzyme YgiQ (UPF0313 family)
MIGFPWETKSDIFKTINFAVKTDCDYAEFHLATAFKGTELYNMLPNKTDNIGRNYFSNPTEIHPEFSITQIIEFRKIAVKLFYLRPRYIIKKLLKINNFYLFKTYLSYGLKTLKSVF